MVNWQFYGEDDKSSTPPPFQKTKFNWTGISVGILICVCVGMIKFIDDAENRQNNPTNSVVKEPVLHTSPFNFVPTNNDYLLKTSPKLKSTMPESDFKSFQQYYGNQNIDNIYKNIPITNGLLHGQPSQVSHSNNLPLSYKGQDLMMENLLNPDNSINSSFPKIKTDIIPENSILNQQNSFDSKTKINGSLD